MKSLVLLCILLATVFTANTQSLRSVDDKSLGLTRKLLAFEHDGLLQYALLIVGDVNGLQSKNIVIVAHGYHPDPPNYGKTTNGQSLRPGDYYRDWINAYAKAGFNVLVPDYRGHNASQGFGYTHQGSSAKGANTQANNSQHPEQLYTSDLLAALHALQRTMQSQFTNVVLVGHSMGAPIAFYAGQQLPNQAKLVSLWSSAQFGFEARVSAPNFIIHHGQTDAVTPVENTQFFIDNYPNNLLSLHIYKSAEHMLTGNEFNQAINTDIALIKEVFNAH
jgi:dienelactone hydrolase